MLFGILTLTVALSISAVAIYYSVAGLVAIFAAATVPIIIMGGALEIGKLVAAVWLHKYWDRSRWWLRLYLSVAVLVLMFITSMGIFGFLSKAHIEQTSAATEQQAILLRFEAEVVRQEEVIARSEERIAKAEADADKQDVGIQAKLDKEQERINSAYTRRQPSISEQLSIINAQETTLNERVSVFENEINSLDTEIVRINGLVEEYRTQLSNTNVASVEEQVQPYIDQITQLDNDIARLDDQASAYEVRIGELVPDYSAVDTLKSQIIAIEESVVVTTNKLQSTERDKVQEGQAVIGVTSDGLFGGNTRRALESWVTAQQDRIANLQSQETELRSQAQSVIAIERQRLTGLVTNLRGAQLKSVQQRKQDLLDTIARIRNESTTSLDSTRNAIQEKINAILNTDIPTVREQRKVAQDTITNLRNTPNIKIENAQTEIARLRQLAEDEITQSQSVIERLRAEIQIGENINLDEITDIQLARIKEANTEIDRITNDKFALQAEARKLEAEVGPVKYLAEFIYENADRTTLEDAVRWVILIIIFVFDPLAVVLLIAAQYIFTWRREDKFPSPPRLEPKIKKPEPQVEPKKEELVVSILPELEEVIQVKQQMSEVVNIAPDNKTVDKLDYDPYTDTRPTTVLTKQERERREIIWPDGYDGKLAPPKPFKEQN
jgi:hypothetical protein